MKKNTLYILILTALGCNNPTNQSDKTIHADTTKQTTSVKSKYYTTNNPQLIITETGDTLKYSKDEFNKIVDNHSELTSEYTNEPDQMFYCNGNIGDFGSEVGQDNYYILYAYFLKQKNSIDNYAERRKN